ncbi:MAG: hypothetical protein JSR80_08395 [Verrucomicrobia bacterium]|nr:hypothetical protein [Verrucomicrobiota bacterium]
MKTVMAPTFDGNTKRAIKFSLLGVCGIVAHSILGSKIGFNHLIQVGLVASIGVAGIGAIWLRNDINKARSYKADLQWNKNDTFFTLFDGDGWVNRNVVIWLGEKEDRSENKKIEELEVVFLHGLYFAKQCQVKELPKKYEKQIPAWWAKKKEIPTKMGDTVVTAASSVKNIFGKVLSWFG